VPLTFTSFASNGFSTDLGTLTMAASLKTVSTFNCLFDQLKVVYVSFDETEISVLFMLLHVLSSFREKTIQDGYFDIGFEQSVNYVAAHEASALQPKPFVLLGQWLIRSHFGFHMRDSSSKALFSADEASSYCWPWVRRNYSFASKSRPQMRLTTPMRPRANRNSVLSSKASSNLVPSKYSADRNIEIAPVAKSKPYRYLLILLDN